MTRVLALLLLIGFADSARADATDWATVGVGANYGFVTGEIADDPEVPSHQYGLLTRGRLFYFLGLEVAAQLDNDPKTQHERHLSPRFGLGAMINVVPIDLLTLFVVGGYGAHRFEDLFDLNGETSSLQIGPGIEVYVNPHVAVGGDFRFRMPGPTQVKADVADERSTEPISEALELRVWQANLTVAYYL